MSGEKSATAACVDASLVVRLLNADSTAVSAWEDLVRADGDLIAPSLLHYEVANALHQQRRAGVVSSELAGLQLDRCLRLPIELYGDARLHARALEIAHEHQLQAMYDAHYLALAERFRVPLWTCDQRLAKELSEGPPEVHLVL